MMKKTLVAVAALAASAAFAQVTISGRIAEGIASIGATGAAAGAGSDFTARTAIVDYSSRLRFAVNEDLGGGMRAFGVYEFGLSYDTGTQNGQSGTGAANATAGTSAIGNTSVGFLGSRESHVGIGNSLIELRVGRQNVYWTQGDLSETGANKVGKDVIADMYTRVANVRQNNSILLNLNGDAGAFAGSQLYWAPEVASETQTAGSPAVSQNATTMGAKLNWDQGAFHFMGDYQKRSNIANDAPAMVQAASAVYDATSIKLGLGYRYAPGSMVAIHYWDMKKESTDPTTNALALVVGTTGSINGAGTGGGNKQTGWALSLTHALPANYIAYANYGVLNSYSGTAGQADLADSGATAVSVGLRKELSKRTALFGAYGKVNNNANSNYAPTGGGFMPFTANPGSSPTYTTVGIMHNF